MSDQRVPLPGSAPSPHAEAGAQPRWSSAVDANEKASVTITLRRRHDSAAADMEKQLLSGQGRSIPREQAAEQISADPRDITAVRSFLEQHGLTVTEENAAARTLKAEGTVQQLGEAFSTRIGWFEDSAGGRHMSYEGSLSIPQSLADIIVSVVGLDQRPIAKRREAP
jgi:kumamolisin